MAGTPGACSQVFCHPIRCIYYGIWKNTCHKSRVRTTTTTTTTTPPHHHTTTPPHHHTMDKHTVERGVPPPDIGGVGFGSSPNFVTKHTIYVLCLPSERGCVAMSCGGVFFTPDGAYDSVWDGVRLLTGKYSHLFPVPRGRGCVCMLNGWFSSNDTICADNYIYFLFMLKGQCRREKWEVFLYGYSWFKAGGPVSQ